MVTEKKRQSAEWLPSKRTLKYLGAWAAGAAFLIPAAFFSQEIETQVAGHSAVIQPTHDGNVTIDADPVIEFRNPIDLPLNLGFTVDLGTTQTPEEVLVAQYAAIAQHPDGELSSVSDDIKDAARDSALIGGGLAMVPLGLWAMVGKRRRQELWDQALAHHHAVTASVSCLAVGMVLAPHAIANQAPQTDETWQTIEQIMAPTVVPEKLRTIEIKQSTISNRAVYLVKGFVESYEESEQFYGQIAEDFEQHSHLLERPGEGQASFVLVSDRHDNIGMDEIVEVVANSIDAKIIFNVGDNDSSGSDWENFSAESFMEAMNRGERKVYVVKGNHDSRRTQKDFVENGATDLIGEVIQVELPNGAGTLTLLGDGDPRYSDYTSARNPGEESIEQVSDRLAEVACSEPDGVDVLLVHDRDMGTASLGRGCVRAVLRGHEHVVEGPVRTVGINGNIGYGYTNGTTGGAAYSINVGRIRRDATITTGILEDGKIISIQTITVTTDGRWVVAPANHLDYTPANTVNAKGANNNIARAAKK